MDNLSSIVKIPLSSTLFTYSMCPYNQSSVLGSTAFDLGRGVISHGFADILHYHEIGDIRGDVTVFSTLIEDAQAMSISETGFNTVETVTCQLCHFCYNIL